MHVDAAFIAGLPHAGHCAVTDAEAKRSGLRSQGAPPPPPPRELAEDPACSQRPDSMW